MTADAWARRLAHVRRRASTLGARVAVVGWDEPTLVQFLRSDARTVRLVDADTSSAPTDVRCSFDRWPVSSGALSGVVLGREDTSSAVLDEIARVLEPGGLLLWTARVGPDAACGSERELEQCARDAGLRVVGTERLYGDVDAVERRPAPGTIGLWWEQRCAGAAASARVLLTARREGGRGSALAELPGMGESLRSMFIPRWPRRRGTGRRGSS